LNSEIEKLRQEREKRIQDAIDLKIPDRVPVTTPLGYFPAKFAGIPCSAAYYDFDAWIAAYRKTLDVFKPDQVGAQFFTPGKALEILNPRISRWPGHGADPNHSHQAIELEIMKAKEYDELLDDPTDYMIRKSMARVCESTAALENLPKLSDLGVGMFGAQILADALIKPEIAAAIEALQNAGREMAKWRSKNFEFHQMVQSYGFPNAVGGFAMCPFDTISHSMRGLRGTITDMYRQPDKLLEACDKLLELSLKKLLPKDPSGKSVRVFIPLTRGSDDFMSLKQFEKFYWPTLKKLILHIIEQGATPAIFFEGNFITRLEHLLDLPKGKILAQLDTTDIFKAKQILREHMCIQGNVPSSLLQVGSVQDVKEHCKKLIDVVGKDGGYILSPRGSADEVKPENLMAMIEFTKEYGVYR